MMSQRYEVVAFGAHPDDLEAVIGGTTAKLVDKGWNVLFVDLTPGEPTRFAPSGRRREEAERAARILGINRIILEFQDRFVEDSIQARLAVARIIRIHQPLYVFTTDGSGIHPDHKAIKDVVAHGVFYARLPKWEEVPGAEMLNGTDPHEIDRLFFGHCRMEPPWPNFDFAVDVTKTHNRKLEALAAYRSVFSGGQAELLAQYSAEDRFYGSLVGTSYAEAFKARSPLLVEDPSVFLKAHFG
jgi:LmbE family N-acetylglucosaminyl deacetylase